MYPVILHATDLIKEHYSICQKAMEIAAKFNATIHFLHVIEAPASVQWAQSLGFSEMATPAKDDAETVMSVLGEAIGLPREQQHVVVGSAHQKIIETINELGCELVILGTHHRNPLGYLGSTSRAIIKDAPCDVMTLRP